MERNSEEHRALLAKAGRRAGLNKEEAERTAEKLTSQICGVICNCGANGEPLACGYLVGHEGKHSWASLPTFVHDVGQEQQGGNDTLARCKECGHLYVADPEADHSYCPKCLKRLVEMYEI